MRGGEGEDDDARGERARAPAATAAAVTTTNPLLSGLFSHLSAHLGLPLGRLLREHGRQFLDVGLHPDELGLRGGRVLGLLGGFAGLRVLGRLDLVLCS